MCERNRQSEWADLLSKDATPDDEGSATPVQGNKAYYNSVCVGRVQVCTSFIARPDTGNLLYVNGVKRRAINFGDPFHIANLVVTWASIGAFGDTEKAYHTQVHHRQLLQSMHSLHNDNSTFSQALIDDIMTDSTGLVIRTCREHVQ